MRSKETMHKIMSGVHSKNTKPEQILRKALWQRGIRYRKNYDKLPGRPDIAITRCKIAIFVDGDFWHGRNMEKIDKEITQNRQYWLPKLRKNKMRDEEVNDILTEKGWLVIRFWESDIKKDIDSCVKKILQYIPYRSNNNH